MSGFRPGDTVRQFMKSRACQLNEGLFTESADFNELVLLSAIPSFVETSTPKTALTRSVHQLSDTYFFSEVLVV